MTWFQDLTTEVWWNSQQVSRAYVAAVGTEFFIQFRESDGSVVSYGGGYATEDLAEIALAALAATWTV